MSVKMRNFAVQLMFNQEQGNMKYFVITVLTLLLGFYTSWAQPSSDPCRPQSSRLILFCS